MVDLFDSSRDKLIARNTSGARLLVDAPASRPCMVRIGLPDGV
jgi:hypothetical protein